MSLFVAVTPVQLPSGELADFTNWFTAADLATAVNVVNARDASLSANTSYKSLFQTTVAFGSSKVTQIDQATGKTITSTTAGTAYAGTATAYSLPPQCAICVSVSGLYLTRSTRGRFYLPAPTINTITLVGRLAAANVAFVVSAQRAALDAMITAGGQPVVYSRKLKTVTSVVTLNVGDVIDTVRTRRDKLVESRQGVTIP